jgi:hypothetical protein
MNMQSKRLPKALAAVRAAGALAAMVTLAAMSLVVVASAAASDAPTRPDDQATHGPGAIAAASSSDVVRPDDRPTHGPGAVTVTTSTAVRPDDRPTHGVGSIGPSTLVVTASPAGGGFDWIDAGVGAAFGMGASLIVAGALLAGQRRRRGSVEVA